MTHPLTSLLVAVLLAGVPLAVQSTENAAALAALAETILDHWDGDAADLATAKAAIDKALDIDPASAHARGIKARQILLAGTSEEGTKPSALRAAQGILMRAAVDGQPADARVFAFLARVGMQTHFDKVQWALNEAQQLGPDDPWVDLAWAEATHDLKYLQKAIDDGLANPIELRPALDKLLARYLAARRPDKAAAIYERRVALDPTDALVRGDYAREVIVNLVDFTTGERVAREALALKDYPHARQSLSLALYGRWAQAARDREGPDKVEALYRKAQAFDPGAHLIPTCLADWKPLEFVYSRLEQKQVRREEMHQC